MAIRSRFSIGRVACLERGEQRQKNSLTPSISTYLPNEILSMILRACLDQPFTVEIIKPHFLDSGAVSRPRVIGIPALLNLKLVNSFFYDGIWASIADNFNGRIILRTIRAGSKSIDSDTLLGKAMIQTINNISDLNTDSRQLSRLGPRISNIDCGLLNYEAFRELRMDRLPSLKKISLQPLHQTQHYEIRDCELNDALAGKIDVQAISAIKKEISALPSPSFVAFQQRQISLVWPYPCKIGQGDWVVFDCNITDPEDISISSRQHLTNDGTAVNQKTWGQKVRKGLTTLLSPGFSNSRSS